MTSNDIDQFSTGNTGKLALIIISREPIRQASGPDSGRNTEADCDSSQGQGTTTAAQYNLQCGRGQGDDTDTNVGHHHKSHRGEQQGGKFHCFIFEILNLNSFLPS
jgi:hypothetical protein